jgi:hypothetical protein
MVLLTTRQNVEQLQELIPFHLLTKTFQDAIIITFRLGLKYVWIDSLCILQGDDDDWVRESANMGSIFARCFLNIVASDAPDGTVGCFFTRDPFYETGFKVLARAQKESEDKSIWNCISPGSRRYTEARGWCYQETLLAPRSLYFCEEQLFWECRKFRASETFPQGTGHKDFLLKELTSSWLKPDLEKNFVHLSRDWFLLVSWYSSGNLSFRKDRLPAMSGIARAFCQAYSMNREGGNPGVTQNYLAGMWKVELEEQLMWSTYGGMRPPRYLHENAPTWSWASIMGAVWLETDEVHRPQLNFRVLEASVVPASDDEYGEVRSGTLKLQCYPLIRVTLVDHPLGKLIRYLAVDGEKLEMTRVFLDEPPEVDLPLFAMHSSKLEWIESEEGLLLWPAEKEGVYRRAGAYMVYFHDLPQDFDLSKRLPFQAGIGEEVITII